MEQPQQSHHETNKRVNIFPREPTPHSDVFLFDQFNASHMHHSNLTTLVAEGLSNLCGGGGRCWFPLFSVFPDQTFIVSRLKCCAFADFVLIKVVPAQGKPFSGLRYERDLIHTLKYDKKDGLAVQVYHG